MISRNLYLTNKLSWIQLLEMEVMLLSSPFRLLIQDFVEQLATSGIDLIEIGHGLGLNGFSHPSVSKYKCESDESHIIAAIEGRKDSKTTKIGCFCIPGIAKIEHLKKAIDLGIDFVRIGVDGIDYKKSIPFINEATKAGIGVCVNIMKTYSVSFDEFSNIGASVASEGIDLLYIVDSAGGMVPEEIKGYIESVSKLDCYLGFHAHNNLGLAVINSCMALEYGVKIVDTSIMGLGRSAGNAATEQVYYVLKRMGREIPLDISTIHKIADSFIKNRKTVAGSYEIDCVLGFSRFHSSYMPLINKYAKKYNISEIDLILEVSRIDKVTPTEVLIQEVALNISKSGRTVNHHFISDQQIRLREDYIGNEQQ